MEKILSRMTGEELLLLRIAGDRKTTSAIEAELNRRARTDANAPIWGRSGRVGRANRAASFQQAA